MDTWLVVMILGEFAFICFIIWMVVYSRTNKARIRSDERLRVLERFNSSEELNDFFKTEAGREFLHLFAVAPSTARLSDPRRLILLTVALGILSLFTSGGFGVLTQIVKDESFAEIFAIWAVVLGAGGVGILVAAGISVVLARSWNLTPEPGGGDDVS